MVIKASGRYHRALHQSRCVIAATKVVLANPLRARRFAEAKGDLAKTDRVDAAMLAVLGRCSRICP